MKTFLVGLAILGLSGCIDFRTEYKCRDGVIYMKDNGAWIQAKLFEQNKCLAADDEPAGYRCQDGITLVEKNGVWSRAKFQSKFFESNTCSPMTVPVEP